MLPDFKALPENAVFQDGEVAGLNEPTRMSGVPESQGAALEMIEIDGQRLIGKVESMILGFEMQRPGVQRDGAFDDFIAQVRMIGACAKGILPDVQWIVLNRWKCAEPDGTGNPTPRWHFGDEDRKKDICQFRIGVAMSGARMGKLKRLIMLTAAGAWLGVTQIFAHAAPDLLAGYHFTGVSALATNTNAAKIREIWMLKQSVDLREEMLRKLAAAPSQLVARRVKSAGDQSALFRPLLDDLLNFESLAEVRGGSNGVEEIVLAIRLNDKRAETWQANLGKLAESWMGAASKKISSHKFPGWESKTVTGANTFRVVRAGEWVIAGGGGKDLPLMESWTAAVAGGKGLPKLKQENWLEADIDWSRLHKWLPANPFKLARTEIAVTGKDDALRTTARVVYPESLNWKSEKWKIPKDIMRDPIASFTAARNLGVLVKEPAEFQKLSVRPMTNQIFVWALQNSPFHTFAAVPDANPARSIQTLGKELPAIFNDRLAKSNDGSMAMKTNEPVLLWTGLPLIAPEIRATNNYLLAGLFPGVTLKDPVPAELLQQVETRTNLIYYDWEITEYRLGQWLLLQQLFPPMKPDDEKGSPSVPVAKRFKLHDIWQSAVAKLLGNTVTEVTLTAPNEVNVLRKSHAGFTGIELIFLSRWINHPDFPLFGFQLPAEKPAAAR